MAKIGWGEFVVILVIALLVLGPEKLPQAARALGKAIRSVKKYVSETTQELEEIDGLKDIRSDVEGIRKDLRTMGSDLEKSVAEDAAKMEKDMNAAGEELRTAVEKEPEAPKNETPAKTPEEDPPETPAKSNAQEEI